MDWYPATVAEIRAFGPFGGRADTAASALPAMKFTCGVFLNGAFTDTQAVTLGQDGGYQSTVGKAGRYRFA